MTTRDKWRLTCHALRAATVRGYDVGDVLLAACDPEIRYTQETYGPGFGLGNCGEWAATNW